MSIATIEDAAAICAIQNNVIAKSNAILAKRPRSLEDVEVWLTERLENDWPVLLAKTEEGDVLGYGTYGPFRAREGFETTVEHSVQVNEGARGQGIGSMLLSALINHAKRADFAMMVGSIDDSDEVALQFHCKHGFAETGRLPGVANKGGKVVDLVLVQRKL